MLGVSQCDLHTATSNQQSSRSPEVAAGSVAGIHPNQRHPRGAVDRISPSRELKGRVRETYDVDFTEGPPSLWLDLTFDACARQAGHGAEMAVQSTLLYYLIIKSEVRPPNT